MNQDFKGIEKLQSTIKEFGFKIKVIEKSEPWHEEWFVWVEVKWNKKTFTLLIEDEYDEFNYDSPEFHFFLFLNELTDYKDEKDFLEWSHLKCMMPGNNEIWDYYRSLDPIYHQVNTDMGGLTTCISVSDYHLNAGETQELRRREG